MTNLQQYHVSWQHQKCSCVCPGLTVFLSGQLSELSPVMICFSNNLIPTQPQPSSSYILPWTIGNSCLFICRPRRLSFFSLCKSARYAADALYVFSFYYSLLKGNCARAMLLPCVLPLCLFVADIAPLVWRG